MCKATETWRCAVVALSSRPFAWSVHAPPPPPPASSSSRLFLSKVLKGHDDHVITCLQFCGNRIVSGSDDNTLKVWSAITGKVRVNCSCVSCSELSSHRLPFPSALSGDNGFETQSSSWIFQTYWLEMKDCCFFPAKTCNSSYVARHIHTAIYIKHGQDSFLSSHIEPFRRIVTQRVCEQC